MSNEIKDVSITMGKVDKQHVEAIKAVAKAFEAYSEALRELAKSVKIDLTDATGIKIER